MIWIHLLVLGAIQGLTEFLPISSDGHLAIAEMLLGIKEDNLAITVALHSGTLLAVLVYFREDLLRLARALPKMASGPSPERSLLIAIVAGSAPTAIIGLALKHPTEQMSTNLWAIGLFLAVSGAWNYAVVIRSKRTSGNVRPLEAIRVVDAIGIGIVQGFAVMPGLSRSGSTIGLGTLLGLSREAAARYSFLLSLPAVAGALLLEAKDISAFPTEQLLPVLLGSVVSFGVGIAALAILFRVLRSGRFDMFAFYCWSLAIAVFLAAGLGK